MAELAVLAERYLTSRRRKGELDPVTVKNHRAVLHSLTATYGDRPARNFRRLHVDRWLETRGHLKASTRRSQYSMVHGFTRWLVLEGHLRRDPMAGMTPPAQPRTIPRAMPSGDIGILLRSVPDARARAIVALGVWCGLRCVEIANLKVEDWDRRLGYIRVTGKGGHEREVPVPEDAHRHLRNYLFENPATVGPLIRSHRCPWEPIRASTISKLVAEWMAEAGVKLTARDGVSAHALRHTAATDVLDQCGDIRVVQGMLGHRHLSSTEIYLLRADLPKMRNAMEGRNYSQT